MWFLSTLWGYSSEQDRQDHCPRGAHVLEGRRETSKIHKSMFTVVTYAVDDVSAEA